MAMGVRHWSIAVEMIQVQPAATAVQRFGWTEFPSIVQESVIPGKIMINELTKVGKTRWDRCWTASMRNVRATA
jgi:hypothetical protein